MDCCYLLRIKTVWIFMAGMNWIFPGCQIFRLWEFDLFGAMATLQLFWFEWSTRMRDEWLRFGWRGSETIVPPSSIFIRRRWNWKRWPLSFSLLFFFILCSIFHSYIDSFLLLTRGILQYGSLSFRAAYIFPIRQRWFDELIEFHLLFAFKLN